MGFSGQEYWSVLLFLSNCLLSHNQLLQRFSGFQQNQLLLSLRVSASQKFETGLAGPGPGSSRPVAWGEQKLQPLGRAGRHLPLLRKPQGQPAVSATLVLFWDSSQQSGLSPVRPLTFQLRAPRASVSANKAERVTFSPPCWEVARSCSYHTPPAEAVTMPFPGSRGDAMGPADLSGRRTSKSHWKKSKSAGRQACGYLLQRESASEKNRSTNRQISFMSSEPGKDSFPPSCLGPGGQ